MRRDYWGNIIKTKVHDLDDVPDAYLASQILDGYQHIQFKGKIYYVNRNGLNTQCGGSKIILEPPNPDRFVDPDYWELVPAPNSDRRFVPSGNGIYHVYISEPTPDLVDAMYSGMAELFSPGSHPWHTMAQGKSDYNRRDPNTPWYTYYGVVHYFDRDMWNECFEVSECCEPEECPNCGSYSISGPDNWGNWICNDEDCEYQWDPRDWMDDEHKENDDNHSLWAGDELATDRSQYKLVRKRVQEQQLPKLSSTVFIDRYLTPFEEGTVPVTLANIRENSFMPHSNWDYGLAYQYPNLSKYHHQVLASAAQLAIEAGGFGLSTNVSNPGYINTLGYIAHLHELEGHLGQMGLGLLVPSGMGTNPNEGFHSIDSAIVYVKDSEAAWRTWKSRFANTRPYFENVIDNDRGLIWTRKNI